VETRYARETAELVVEQITHITDALPTTDGLTGATRASYHYYMAPWETTVIVDSAANAFNVNLPPVQEAKGRIYTVAIITYAAAAVAVIDYKDDSEDFPATISLNANYDRVCMYSDGIHWWILVDMFT